MEFTSCILIVDVLSCQGGCVSRVYSPEFLFECSKSQLACVTPLGWERICKEFPGIVKKVVSAQPQPPTQLFMPFRRHSYNDAPYSTTPQYSYTDSWTSADQYTYANWITTSLTCIAFEYWLLCAAHVQIYAELIYAYTHLLPTVILHTTAMFYVFQFCLLLVFTRFFFVFIHIIVLLVFVRFDSAILIYTSCSSNESCNIKIFGCIYLRIYYIEDDDDDDGQFD